MPESKLGAPQLVNFHYVKSPHFRVLHVDGAVGGVTPRGHIHAAFYSERPAIAKHTTHEIDPSGHLGSEKIIEGKDGIVREMDVDIILSRTAAVELQDWLSSRIRDLDDMLGSSEKGSA